MCTCRVGEWEGAKGAAGRGRAVRGRETGAGDAHAFGVLA